MIGPLCRRPRFRRTLVVVDRSVIARLAIVAAPLLGCREAGEAMNIDVDRAERVADQAGRVADQAGERVAEGLEVARDQVEAAGKEIGRAAQDVGQRVDEAAQGAVVDDAALREQIAREAETAVVCGEQSCTITQALADRLRANPGVVLHQAHVEPHRVDGRAVGMRISRLEPLPLRMGFRDGDLLVSVNGLALQSLQSAPQLYLQLRSARRFTVVFERDSQRRTFVLEVVADASK